MLLFYGGAGVVLCLLHGVFRPRSIGSKASRVSAEAKAGFTIEVRAGSSDFFVVDLFFLPVEIVVHQDLG